MPEKRGTRTKSSQLKVQRPTAQKTLKDLFRKTNISIATSSGKEQDFQSGRTPTLEAADPVPPTKPPQPPKSIQLYPIFKKVSSVRGRPRDTIINVDDTEVIDITDMSSDMELSTELASSSTHQLFPRPEPCRKDWYTPPPSPIHLDIQGSSGTSVTHVGKHAYEPAHKTSNESSKRTLSLEDAVPFPSSCSQHVRGVQHSYTSSQTPLKHRVFPGSSPPYEGALNSLTKWRDLDDTPSIPLDRVRFLTSRQCEENLQSLSRDCAEAHPVFARISVQREGISLCHAEMWTRRFRPRRASEVLGNEQHALYLRDWLRALELRFECRQPEEPVSKGAMTRDSKAKHTSKRAEPRGVKRPRVVRDVAKKRGNKKRRVDSDDDLDDFVVFSDADEEPPEDPPEDLEDELAFCQRTLARLHRRETTDTHNAQSATLDDLGTDMEHTTSELQGPTETNFADNLTNTLLMTGPSGCGKTAAVYACAEELGWEVFEVYPGIGRRNGANLDHLVGDVGRNHIVQTVHRRAPNKMTKVEAKECMRLHGYLGKKKAGGFARLGESQEAGTEGQPISVEGEGPRHEPQPLPSDLEKDSLEEAAHSDKWHGEPDRSRPIVRQSLVLLEEVDILFREDAGFWPAVVDFIRCCQRPVVMTCNDAGLVPLGDLPLQTVLVFEPCPSTVAATFLQCVSLAEGCHVPHEDLMVLYENVDTIEGLAMPDAPRAETVRLPDLRRAITQLQMLCAGARHGSASEMHQDDEAEGHVRRSARPISAASRVTAIGSRVESEWWRKVNRHSELMSHVDAELCREPMNRGKVVSDEVEVGYVMVEEREGLEHDELIAEEAIRYSRGAHEEGGTGPNKVSINPAAVLDTRGFRARVEYQSRMAAALQDVVSPPGCLRSVYLDYIPWVRHMVLVDDDLERRALYGRGGSGRWTRNSLRTVHARNVVLGEEGRTALRMSQLGVLGGEAVSFKVHLS